VPISEWRFNAGSSHPHAKPTRRSLAMGDIISIVYTAVIFAALIGFVTFCRKV
jgi:hypothetical protein